MVSFEYPPLPGSRHIRLLRLYARQEQDTGLHGTFEVRDLDDSEPQYTSLSYSWGRNSDGDASLSHTMVLEGQDVAITENLHDCLIQLSKPGNPDMQTLWIDALCINQEDDKERGEQVSMMADVYREASDLVIWLGHGANEFEDEQAMEALSLNLNDHDFLKFPSDGDALATLSVLLGGSSLPKTQKRAFELACQLARRYRPWHVKGKPPLWLSQILPKIVQFALGVASQEHSVQRALVTFNPETLLKQLHTKTLLYDAIGPELFKNLLAIILRLYSALVRLCQRRYFSRRWIIQEIYATENQPVLIRWASFAMPLDHFRERLRRIDTATKLGTSTLYRRGMTHLVEDETLQRQHDICEVALDTLDMHSLRHESAMHAEGRLILYCLRTYQHTACSDARDLLYAFASIPKDNASLSVDYTSTASEVFFNLAQILVKQDSVGMVLSVASWQQSESRRLRPEEEENALPSWVPHLSRPLPPINKFSLRGALLPTKADNYDTEAKIVPQSKILSFQARIGKLTTPAHGLSSPLKDALRTVHDGEFLCETSTYTEVSGFVLRPLGVKSDSFTLTGNWNVNNETRKQVWAHCSDVEIKTIYLH